MFHLIIDLRIYLFQVTSLKFIRHGILFNFRECNILSTNQYGVRKNKLIENAMYEVVKNRTLNLSLNFYWYEKHLISDSKSYY